MESTIPAESSRWSLAQAQVTRPTTPTNPKTVVPRIVRVCAMMLQCTSW